MLVELLIMVIHFKTFYKNKLKYFHEIYKLLILKIININYIKQC